MPRTQVRSHQLKDDDISREDINITDTGKAVILKAVAGNNVSLSSTGVDTGTGDVTINVNIIDGGEL